jgi:two-component system, response regulator PdtaR
VCSKTNRPVVLIVEDEFLIRMDALNMIRSAGFDVVEAQNADEAIFILEGRPDITVVFTDVQMPGSMTAWRTASWALSSRSCGRLRSPARGPGRPKASTRT